MEREPGAVDLGADPGHVPVLVREVLESLAPRPGATVVDCTAGRGGHAAAMAALIGAGGTLVLCDADERNLAFAEARVRGTLGAEGCPRIVALHANFAEAPRLLVERGLSADVVLADLGFASTHMDDAARGFAFRHDGPLDMRYDRRGGLTAETIVNTWSEQDLCELIRDFGEDRAARRIAAAIVRAREQGAIGTTTALARVVRGVLPPKQQGGIDPATRTFQALRIAVNDELGALRSLLESISRAAGALAVGARGAGSWPGGGSGGGRQWVSAGARIGIISFHSLEDRAVKNAMADCVGRGLARALSRKPIVPGAGEMAENPRSRSAKLRAMALVARPGDD
ncbi:MAG: 16S rRNA (cytosine(1402)-N(4))-methyltransferase RsmH [Phycisphaerales bacterium]